MSCTLTTRHVLASLAALLMITSVVAPATALSAASSATDVPDPGIDTSASETANESASGGASSVVSHHVRDLIAAAESGGTDSELLTQSGGETRITVTIEATPGEAGAVADLATEHGSVTSRFGDAVEASIPTAAVDAIANASAVEVVRLPTPAIPTHQGSIVSEGLPNMNVSSAHADGHEGSGITVAVVDSGFNVSNPEIADHVAGFTDYDGDNTNSSGQHGTAVAELVVDTAPNVTLLLYEVRSGAQIGNAVEDITNDTDADIATMSLALLRAPVDGTSPIDAAIDDSVDSGVTWFVSSGNYADGQHYNQTWSDPDGDGWLNTSSNRGPIEVNAEGKFTVYVNWNQSGEDYDVYLNQSGRMVASSTDGQPPFKPSETVSANEGGTYTLEINNDDANGTADFDVFVAGPATLVPSTSARSVSHPATARRALAVGAVYYGTNELEGFSSRGPTVDGRLKPELVAPDGVQTSQPAYSNLDRFFGTSAAAPHAAGVAALVLDAVNDSIGPDGVRESLTSNATRLEAPVPNNRTGYGLVNATGAVETAQVAVRNESLSLTQDHSWTSRNGTNTSKMVGVTADANLSFDNGTNYRIRLRNEDSGESVELTLGGSATLPAGAPLALFTYDADGTVSARPVAFGRAFESAPLETANGSIPAANGLTNFSVALLDASDGSTVARTATHPAVVGYTGVLSQNSTAGTVDLSVPRDVVPSGASVRLRLEPRGDGNASHSRMSYDSANGTFVTTIRAEDFESGNYSWNVYFDSEGIQVLSIAGDRPNSLKRNVTLGPTDDADEFVTVTGSITDANGNPAANDTVTSDSITETADDGSFAVSVPSGVDAGIAYFQTPQEWFVDVEGTPEPGSAFPNDGSPDVYALAAVNVSSETGLGGYDLPAAHRVNVTVLNESGHPVENATVVVAHTNDTTGALAYASMRDATNPDGMLRPLYSADVGIELVGDVIIEVEPPEGGSFVDRTYTKNLTVTNPDSAEFTLNETTCVNRAVAGDDGRISLTEIQGAIDRWATGADVPETGGETISLAEIQSLIDAWATDATVSCSR